MADVAAPSAAPAAPAAAPSSPPPSASATPPAAKPDATKPVAAGTKPPEAPKPVGTEKFLVKVNGKLRELSRDDALRELQKGIASRETFEKAAAKEKRVAAIFKALQDPNLAPEQEDEYLRQLGRDPDKIAERRLARRAQEAQLTPEQKRIAELEAKIAADQRTSQQRDEQVKAERLEQADREHWSKLETEYTAEIDRARAAGDLGGMTAAEALYHMCDAAELNLGFNLELSPQELVAEAKAKVAEVREEMRSKALNLDGEQLLGFLGPEAVNKVLKAAVAKYKGGQPIQQLERPAQISSRQAEPVKWKRPTDVRPPWL
jgi:hypothetical protein